MKTLCQIMIVLASGAVLITVIACWVYVLNCMITPFFDEEEEED